MVKEDRPHQPVLPGMDLLSTAVGALRDRQITSIQQKNAEMVEKSHIIPTQAIVTREYEDTIVIPRRVIWNDTVALLNKVPSEQVTIRTENTGYSEYANWKFATVSWELPSLLIGQNASDAGADIFTTVSVTLDAPGGSDLRRALLYTTDSRFGEGSTVEELLGVLPQGRRKNRKIPYEPLKKAVEEEFLKRTDKLSVSVKTQLFGSEERTPLWDFTVDRNRFAVPAYYLDPEHAPDVDRHVRLGYYQSEPGIDNGYRGEDKEIRDHEPTAEEIEVYLRERYIDPGIGEEFEKLRAINMSIIGDR